jgi:hypothetical protein
MMGATPRTPVQRVLQGGRRDLAAVACKSDELDAATEKLGRAAFVGRDMCVLVAEHRAPRRSEVRKRKRVGRSPGGDQKNRDLMLEEVSQSALGTLGPGIAAVGERPALVRQRDGGQQLRGNSRRVVAREIHSSPSKVKERGINPGAGPGTCRCLASMRDVILGIDCGNFARDGCIFPIGGRLCS